MWAFTSGREETTDDHPTAKPVELWEIPIAEHTRRGDLIYFDAEVDAGVACIDEAGREASEALAKSFAL